MARRKYGIPSDASVVELSDSLFEARDQVREALEKLAYITELFDTTLRSETVELATATMQGEA